MNYIEDDTDTEDQIEADQICTRCKSIAQKLECINASCQTKLDFGELESLFLSLESLENRNTRQMKEIQTLVEENFELKEKNSEYIPIKGRVRKLESQNSILKEKAIDIRRENDMLVEKIQTLQVGDKMKIVFVIAIILVFRRD